MPGAGHHRSRALSLPANREKTRHHPRSDQPSVPRIDPRRVGTEMATHGTRRHRTPPTSCGQRLTHHQESQQTSASGLPQLPTHSHIVDLTPRPRQASQAPPLTQPPAPPRCRRRKSTHARPRQVCGTSQQVNALSLEVSTPPEAVQEQAAAPRRTPSPRRSATRSSSRCGPAGYPPGCGRSNSRT
jgi:hypothetical protein